MKYDVLFNFISPVTGRLCIPEDYILIGDGQGFSTPSPILIDMRLDITNLRRDVNDIFDTSFIIGFPDIDFPNAQVLSELVDGFLYNTAGIISTTPTIPISGLPDLTYKNLWIGDSNNRPIETQRINIDNLPPLNAIEFQIGPITYGIQQMWQGSNDGTVQASYSVSTTLAKIDYAFKSTNWIIGSSGIVPGAISYPNAQFIDQLPSERILTHTTGGVIGVASLTHNYFWIGDENNLPIESNVLPVGALPDLTFRHLWFGDENNRPQESLLIYMDNLPNLTYKAIWRGNSSGRPEETQDLTILEAKVTYIQDVTIPALEAQIEALQGQIAAVEGEIAIIQGQISLLEAAVAVIQGQILTIFATLGDHGNRITTLENKVNQIQQDIIAINARIDALSVTLIGDVTGSGNLSAPITTTLQLTLDQIKIAQNAVNLNNQKIINLKSDNVEQQDALNAKFLWDLMHDQVEVVWV